MEDGKLQVVRSFEEHSSSPAAEQIEPAPKLPAGLFTNKSAAPANGPVNVLLLDYLNTPVTAQANFEKAVDRFSGQGAGWNAHCHLRHNNALVHAAGVYIGHGGVEGRADVEEGGAAGLGHPDGRGQQWADGHNCVLRRCCAVCRCDAGDARRYGAGRCSDYLGGAEQPDAVHAELVRPTGAVPGGHSRAEERDLVLRQLSSGRRAQCQRGRSERLGGPQRRSGAQDGQPADARAGCGVSSGRAGGADRSELQRDKPTEWRGRRRHRVDGVPDSEGE